MFVPSNSLVLTTWNRDHCWHSLGDVSHVGQTSVSQEYPAPSDVHARHNDATFAVLLSMTDEVTRVTLTCVGMSRAVSG